MSANAAMMALVIADRAERAGINLEVAHAHILRRAQLTLRRWAEHECNGHIQRDETTDKPYWHNWGTTGIKVKPFRVPDRERGALKRVAALCKELNLFYYHQTDPRGCALYVSNVPLTDQNYHSAGVACCV